MNISIFTKNYSWFTHNFHLRSITVQALTQGNEHLGRSHIPQSCFCLLTEFGACLPIFSPEFKQWICLLQTSRLSTQKQRTTRWANVRGTREQEPEILVKTEEGQFPMRCLYWTTRWEETTSCFFFFFCYVVGGLFSSIVKTTLT